MQSSRKAILVVSFGTSYPDTRRKTIDRIEEEIGKAFPGYAIYRAFTSDMIIRKIRIKENLSVCSVREALEAMREDGVRELIVQPTHIINGIENEEMEEEIDAYRHEFEQVSIGAPLLTEMEDYRSLVACVRQENPVKQGEALLLMGHGSSHFANAAYPALDAIFRAKGYRDIFLATVKGYPTLEDARKLLQDTDYRQILIVPLMIVAGDHAKKDMDGEGPDSWKSILERAGYQVECKLQGLGELVQVRKMFVEHVRQAMLR